MDLDEYRTDEGLCLDGAWIDLDGATRLRVARADNARFAAALEREQAPHRLAIRAGCLDQATQDAILCRAMAEGILTGWQGLAEDGRDLEYSRAEAARVLGAYPDFRELVLRLARMRRWYREAEIEDAKKN
jgi:hypothetical protein